MTVSRVRKGIILMSSCILLVAVALAVASAHSGRTDKYGGHNNRKTGGYHYHNAGRLHASGNPYQNHSNCGICTSSKSKDRETSSSYSSKSIGDGQLVTYDQLIETLQAGLKCMGYKITNIDGKLGSETEKAVRKYLATREK